jgi:hypothetical protein
MSGVVKAVGKAFKAVFKVVKKVALPILAIGAVVLTGGAALGVLPAFSSVAGSLGLSSTMTGILGAAAKGATLGAVTSAVTGGNIIKGATTGFITGGALGGIGAIGSGAAKTVTTAAQAGGKGGGLFNEAMSTIDKVSGIAPGGGVAPAAAAAASYAPVAVPGGGGILSGVLDYLGKNQVVTAGLIQGIGAGMMASENAKAAQREREAVAANYKGIGAVLNGPTAGFDGTGAARYDPAIYGAPGANGRRVAYDPQTGRVVSVGG